MISMRCSESTKRIEFRARNTGALMWRDPCEEGFDLHPDQAPGRDHYRVDAIVRQQFIRQLNRPANVENFLDQRANSSGAPSLSPRKCSWQLGTGVRIGVVMCPRIQGQPAVACNPMVTISTAKERRRQFGTPIRAGTQSIDAAHSNARSITWIWSMKEPDPTRFMSRGRNCKHGQVSRCVATNRIAITKQPEMCLSRSKPPN